MASIRKRQLASGKIAWQFDYRDQQGNRRSRQFRTRKDAEAFRVKAMSEVWQGTHMADSVSVTVETACYNWLERCEAESLEDSTLLQYSQHVRLHILPFLGSKRLSRLTSPDVENFVDELILTRSRAMARKVLTSLKSILSEAQRRGLAAQNVAAPVKVRARRSELESLYFPSKSELRELSVKAPDRHRTLINLAIFTGMRSSEIRGLIWKFVNLKTGIIRVEQRADLHNKIGQPKSKAGKRSIPLAPIVRALLSGQKSSVGPNSHDLVFPSLAGTVLGISNLRRDVWLPTMQQCGFIEIDGSPRFRFHDLRHGAASLFIEQGWSPKKVQQIVGHASITTTLDRYGHLWPSEENDLKAIDEIQKRLLG